MGNDLCTHNDVPMPQQPIKSIRKVKDEQDLYLVSLSIPIKKRVNQIRPFHDEITSFPAITPYGQDMFQGHFNEEGKPEGLGKMYKSNGSLFVGYFKNGKIEGEGYHFLPDGSFYHGELNENKANDKDGTLVLTDDTQFIGNFVDNNFTGRGKEIGNGYEFEGEYKDGKRIRGLLAWQIKGESYEFSGQFDEDNEFTNYGVLKEPSGTYEGEFLKGKKHGKGTYFYTNKLKYVGQYKNGEKEGHGTIYNKDDSTAYDGEFKNGLPHGKGKKRNKNGEVAEYEYVEGIDSRFLSDPHA